MKRHPITTHGRALALGSVLLAALPGAAGAEELSGFDCLIEPHAFVRVATREDGILEELLVERGDIVSKGDVLARLESGVEEIAVELARARSKMSGKTEGRRAAVKYLKRQKKRIEELHQKKAVAFKEKDQAETDLLLAEMELRDAEETLELSRLDLKRAEQALARRTIRSPVDGIVVQRLMLPGESVEERPIVSVAQVDPLHVEVILPVSLMGRIGAGTEAEVDPLYPGGGTRRARVVVVDRVVDAASNTFGVRLELANPDYEIPGGIRCEIRFVDPAS